MFCDKCGYKNKETAQFCKSCGTKLEIDNFEKENENVELVLENEFKENQDEKNLDKKELLKYLDIAKELEINKLGLENSINDLHKLDKKTYSEIVKPFKKSEKPKFNMFKKESMESIFNLVAYACIPIYLITVFLYRKFYDVFFYKFFAWDFPEIFASVPITIVLGIVLFLIICIINFIIHNTLGRGKYESKVKKCNKENDEIDKKNKLQLVKYDEQKNIINTRLENIHKNLKEVNNTLNKCYDLDVIYPKYRNLVAITTFIEYLESGRCKSLYGYTGCYNVYEQELRQNIIIGKLDQVLIQLEQIKKTQFATFLAIQASNELQASILNTCNNMLSENTRANAMLEAQAQDTKIIKRNSEITSAIATFDYIKK